ncbi:hypothetical protein PR048_009689 [Dryococelus australis]|uniref:Uncharacterized protein n=1 Tax=Dryococelus australis TaxID=614101 RepID=A0ABQ9I101_9NEOP|nr:hypothetical protein PR048_009689 [Dryococelus australis]
MPLPNEDQIYVLGPHQEAACEKKKDLMLQAPCLAYINTVKKIWFSYRLGCALHKDNSRELVCYDSWGLARLKKKRSGINLNMWKAAGIHCKLTCSSVDQGSVEDQSRGAEGLCQGRLLKKLVTSYGEPFKRGPESMPSLSICSPVPFTTFGVICTPASRSMAATSSTYSSNELTMNIQSLVVNHSAGRRTDGTDYCKSCLTGMLHQPSDNVKELRRLGLMLVDHWQGGLFPSAEVVSITWASLHTIQEHVIAAGDTPPSTSITHRWLAEWDLSSQCPLRHLPL